jgi:preprotein translocase subunit SecG
MGFLDILLATFFLIICVLLIVVVLLQKGRGGGLSSAFGGMGSSAFGTRVGDVFTWVTIVLTALFLLLAVTTAMWFRPAPGLVAVPSFSPPANQPYTEPVDVTITCGTSGARVYYTLDGKEPDEKSARYENRPVRVSPDTTLRARAFRRGWQPSRPMEGYYGPARAPATATAPSVEETSQPATAAAQDQPARAPATAPVKAATTAPARASSKPAK